MQLNRDDIKGIVLDVLIEVGLVTEADVEKVIVPLKVIDAVKLRNTFSVEVVTI